MIEYIYSTLTNTVGEVKGFHSRTAMVEEEDRRRPWGSTGHMGVLYAVLGFLRVTELIE